jgi:hypothetical protein
VEIHGITAIFRPIIIIRPGHCHHGRLCGGLFEALGMLLLRSGEAVCSHWNLFGSAEPAWLNQKRSVTRRCSTCGWQGILSFLSFEGVFVGIGQVGEEKVRLKN